MSEVKQVIVVRKDLKMPVGKLAAQVSHASLGSLLNYYDLKKNGDLDFRSHLSYKKNVEPWLTQEFTKVCLAVHSEDELLEVYEKVCRMPDMVCKLIKDAGHTVFSEPTLTCLGVGPFSTEDIDKITGHLKLYR